MTITPPTPPTPPAPKKGQLQQVIVQMGVGMPTPPNSDPNFQWPTATLLQIFDGTNWVDHDSAAGVAVRNSMNDLVHSAVQPATP